MHVVNAYTILLAIASPCMALSVYISHLIQGIYWLQMYMYDCVKCQVGPFCTHFTISRWFVFNPGCSTPCSRTVLASPTPATQKRQNRSTNFPSYTIIFGAVGAALLLVILAGLVIGILAEVARRARKNRRVIHEYSRSVESDQRWVHGASLHDIVQFTAGESCDGQPW